MKFGIWKFQNYWKDLISHSPLLKLGYSILFTKFALTITITYKITLISNMNTYLFLSHIDEIIHNRRQTNQETTLSTITKRLQKVAFCSHRVKINRYLVALSAKLDLYVDNMSATVMWFLQGLFVTEYFTMTYLRLLSSWEEIV